MLAPLLQLLREIRPLSTGLEDALIRSFTAEEYRKGRLLLREKEVCRKLWFLSDGSLRAYHSIGDKEITSRVMFTNHIVIAPGSFFTQTPAAESIQALTACKVLALESSNLQEIYESFPEFNYHTRIITEQYFYKLEQRLYMLRRQSGLDKYRYFLDNYSAILKDIPQKYIASFLNIAPETLSRIRREMSRGQTT